MKRLVLVKIMLLTLVCSHPIYADDLDLAASAMMQGNYDFMSKLLDDKSLSSDIRLLELEIVYHILQDDTDTAINKLEAYLEQNSRNAAAQAFAGEAWRSIGHQVNIFRKGTYYDKAVDAKLLAGTADNTKPKYMVMRASALGQNGKLEEQYNLTNEIVDLDEKWGFVARINLSQNIEAFEEGKDLSALATTAYPHDFFINERTAQFYWTLSDYAQAQKHFLVACRNHPRSGWYDNMKWLYACNLVVRFVEEDSLAPEAGIEALTLLLNEFTLFTHDTITYAATLLKLAEGDDKEFAIAFLERVIKHSNNQQLIIDAQRLLSSLSG